MIYLASALSGETISGKTGEASMMKGGMEISEEGHFRESDRGDGEDFGMLREQFGQCETSEILENQNPPSAIAVRGCCLRGSAKPKVKLPSECPNYPETD